MKKNVQTHFKYIPVYLLLAIFSFWMASNIPYTHDDWDWGLENGIQQLITASINSRYVGNFLEVVMTRSAPLKTLIMGASFFLIPFSTSCIACKSMNRKNSSVFFSVFLLSEFLLLSMNLNVFQQTYGWIAGFSNFVISVLPLTVCIYESLDLFATQPPYKITSFPKLVILFLVIAGGQLFTENLTLYTLLFTFGLCGACYLRTRKVFANYISMFLGSVIGTAIMFSSSIYGTLFSTGSAVDGYRELTLGAHHGLMRSIFNLIKQSAILIKKIWFNNQILCIVIIILVAILIRSNHTLSNKAKNRFTVANCLMLIVFLWGIHLQSTSDPQDLIANIIYVLISILYFPLISVELFLLYRNRREHLLKILFFWLSAPVVIAPLVLTNVAGYRLFFTSNFFMIIVAQHLLIDCFSSASIKNARAIAVSIMICALIVCGNCIHVFSAIGECMSQRAEIIENAKQTDVKQITLPDFPYSDYLWLPNPANESRMEYFKAFYGISPGVEVIINEINES